MSVDERALIDRLEASDVDTLTGAMAHPSPEEEAVLRAHFGDALYQRLHSLALTRSISSGSRRGRVVVIPSTLGTALSSVDQSGRTELVWLDVPGIMAGRLGRLRLSNDGRSDTAGGYSIRPTGMLKRYYGELLLSLAQQWQVNAFWFDWRKDLNLAAAALEAQISTWYVSGQPLHLITHAVGALVARTFIKNYPDRWATLKRSGSRLIMLGPPNHGTFVIPRLMMGLDPTFGRLAQLDQQHEGADLLQVLHSFVGLFHMLPSPLINKDWKRLYDAATYGDMRVPQSHLDHALEQHRLLRSVVDPETMVCILGDGRPTIGPITDWDAFTARDTSHVDTMFGMRLDGDGSVLHELGRLTTSRGTPVPTFYVDESHGNIAANDHVLAAVDELLTTGTTERLSTKPLVDPAVSTAEQVRTRLQASYLRDEQQLAQSVERLITRGRQAGGSARVTSAERLTQELIIRGFLSTARSADRSDEPPAIPIRPVTIEIGLRLGSIANVDALEPKSEPVDAIAVGHYIGLRPQGPLRVLDAAISTQLRAGRRRPSDADLHEVDLILTQYCDRGIVRGELGQPFFLPDPRAASDAPDRLIVIAGMGLPGRFGAPELSILARELCWSLGRQGRRHLATVLIGAGRGNLDTAEAVSAWLRGIKLAVTGAIDAEHRHLGRVTIIENDPRKLRLINDAIVQESRRYEDRNRLKIVYQPLSEPELTALDDQALEWDLNDLRRQRQRQTQIDDQRTPTRVLFQRDGDDFRCGALTESAAIPERVVTLDYDLVMTANDELAAESHLDRQVGRGQFLGGLVVPNDLEDQFTTPAPLVLLLDTTTARIHWEAIAQREASDSSITSKDPSDYLRLFLGTSRSLTRQLRTTFAPPPTPAPPPRRLLRVLIVADPAADARLAGAEEEGAAVAELFEAFNRYYEGLSDNRIQVVRLFGPSEATRTNVLRELYLRSYDVLHFAGHCVFNEAQPAASGWLFTDGELLTARELNRLDRVPAFVFSNACQSGVTPDEPERRSVDLAPNFALSFFARGVTNFVCTAWPVDDLAARMFALELYGGLVGLQSTAAGLRRRNVQPMHLAMRDARIMIARTPNGVRTWGAYQHYGDPNFAFFDRSLMPAL